MIDVTINGYFICLASIRTLLLGGPGPVHKDVRSTLLSDFRVRFVVLDFMHRSEASVAVVRLDIK